jgi:hypothetical protein
MQAIEKIKVAKNKSSQGRCATSTTSRIWMVFAAADVLESANLVSGF